MRTVSARVLIAVGAAAGILLVGARGAVARSTGWTEYGATQKAWNDAHTPDPDPKLVKGCCFLPKLKSGQDQYYELIYAKVGGVSRVEGFSMAFGPAISVSAAKDVVRREAPPAARLVFSLKKSDCLQIAYRSTPLDRAFKTKHSAMLAGLYSSDSGSFNGRTVTEIIFLPATTSDRSIGC